MRHLKATLIIGVITILLVAGLCELDAFKPLDRALWQFLSNSPAEPPLQGIAANFIFAFLAFGTAWVTVDVGRNALKLAVVIAALLQLLSLVWVADLCQSYFSPWAPALAMLLGFGMGMLYSCSEAGRRKRTVQLMFGERISGKNFSKLVDSDVPLNLGGALHEASVVVCEIFNHDALAEALPVPDHVAITNLFLRTGSECLVELGGCLDECDGESLRVVFGAPLPDMRHAETACRAALELVRKLDETNAGCVEKWGHGFDCRIGINSGEMTAAAYGSHRLGAYSVAGEAVEFARSLCAANLVYGSRILIGSGVFCLVEESIAVRPVDLIPTRDGRTREEIYELLGLEQSLSEEEIKRRNLFWKGVIHHRAQRWEEALENFQLALPGERPDPTIEFYIHRIERLRAGLQISDWKSLKL